MNILDVVFLILIFAFFVLNKRLSIVYYLFTTLSLMFGYVLALVLAPAAVQITSRFFHKGLLELALMAVLSGGCWLIGRKFGERVRIRILTSKFSTIDKISAVPYKILSTILIMIMLSQSIIYVPIIALQYLAQGSSFLYATNKLAPDTFVRELSKRVVPNQFINMQLEYDPQPITYDNVKEAGKFQRAVDAVAPSVVKVSGNTCVGIGSGSGFIAGPRFVVTNAHVVTGSSTVYIRDHKGAYPATPILIDKDHDLAVLYSEFLEGRPLTLLDQKVSIGTDVFVLGYPGGGDLQFSEGAVDSGSSRFTSKNTALTADDIVSVTASAAPGNSGGPLFDQKGQVVAVVAGGGGGSGTIGVRSDLALQLVRKAQKRLIPTRTTLCDIGFKYF